MRFWRKAMEKMINPKERKKLDKWKRTYEEAKLAYSDDINAMKSYTKMYDGDRAVNGNPNKSVTPKKVSINVRNITYELIESQVDSSIPMPKPCTLSPTAVKRSCRAGCGW